MTDARDVPAADVGLAIPLRLDAVPRMLRVEHRKAIPAKTIMRRLLSTAETTTLPVHGLQPAQNLVVAECYSVCQGRYHDAAGLSICCRTDLTSGMRLNNQSTHSSVAYSTPSKDRHGPRRWMTSAL